MVGGEERGVDWWRVEIEGDDGRRCISRREVASTCARVVQAVGRGD